MDQRESEVEMERAGRTLIAIAVLCIVAVVAFCIGLVALAVLVVKGVRS